MDFIKKSAEELKGMDAVELQAYYTDKLVSEKSDLEARVKSLEGMKADSEEYAKKSLEIKEANDAKIETLLEAVKTQGIVLEKVKSGAFSGSQMRNLEGTIEKSLEDNAENFKNAKEGRTDFSFELDTKAVGDMTFAANVTGVVPQAQRLEGVNDIAERAARTYALVPKLQTSGNTIEWVYETAQEGAAGGTAEGATKNQLDNNFVVTSVPLLKQTAYFKLSTEMLTEASWMAGWIRNKLIVRLFVDIDEQVLVGGGTGTDLNGILTQATAFSAGTFATGSANEIDNANNADVLVVAALNIRLANHYGNLTIFMNPVDVAVLKTIKLSATDKRYVDRLMLMGSTLSLDGMPIVETSAMTVGSYVIGDVAKAMIAEQGSIKVDVGLDGNDFTKNMRTILAEWKGEVIIENNDLTAFVTGVFATDAAAMETA
jgi:HK97 family phage major capsid protein